MQTPLPDANNGLAGDIISTLQKAQATLATCESLTGGLIGATLTEVPGASEVIRGGLITYATDTKTTLAGVDPDLIQTHGVVSAAVAEAMAAGARQACGADWGVAVTGVAGPGSHQGISAGTVWVAVIGVNKAESQLFQLSGDRLEVRLQVVFKTLQLLLELLRAC